MTTPRRLWVATVTHDATVATPAVAADVSSGAPAGSLEYFAVLFASAARRNDLRALYAFAAEIRRCSALTNHDIAHTRLQWWRQELDRCFAGDAQHPLTRTLQTLRTVIDPSDPTLLRELTVAADLDLAAFEYATWSQLAAYCFRATGALQTVIAAVLASPDPLSEREREVLVAVSRGLSNQEIADQLHMGYGTVKTHVSHLLTKLECRDRAQLVMHAYESGLTVPGRD